MEANGSNQTRLTNASAQEGKPSWSPDGSKILFDSNRDGNGEIYVNLADGSSETNVTGNPALVFESDWTRAWTWWVWSIPRRGRGD